jgi:hypothetical protein
MPSIETSIWLALRGRVESLALSPALAVAWPKEVFTPPQGGTPPTRLAYLEVSHLPNRHVVRGVAYEATHERQGILQIVLKYPIEKAAEQPGHSETVQADIAGQIAAHFPAGLRMSHGDVMLKVERAPDIASSFRDNAEPYWQTPISIRYFGFV